MENVTDIDRYINLDYINDIRYKDFIINDINNNFKYQNTDWIDIAISYDGVDERTKDGQKLIKEFHTTCSNPSFDYKTPWCASFVSHCLSLGGVKGKNPFGSMSSHFSTSNDYIKLDKPKRGAIIYWKNNGSGGHVALVIDDNFDGESVMTIGGNQSAYDKSGSLSQVTIGMRKLHSNSRKFMGFYFPKEYCINKESRVVNIDKFNDLIYKIKSVLNKILYTQEKELFDLSNLKADSYFYLILNEIDFELFYKEYLNH